MAPLATAFVTVLPNMAAFTPAVAAGLRSANFAALGATQGAAYASAFNRSAVNLLAAGAVIGLGLLVKEAVQAAGNFEQAMVRLTTSAGETGTLVSGNLKVVADGIKNMASDVGFGVSELGKAMYLVESAGFRAADGLNVLRFAAEASKAENSDLSTVVDALTTAMIDYHKPASDAASVMNTLLVAASTSKVNLNDLAKSLHSVLPAASAAGVSLEDVLGALSAMTLHGYSAQQATQNLADVIRHMQNPTNVQARELALLGLTTNQLADDLRSKGLTGTLQMISDRIRNLMPPGSSQVVLQLQTALNKLSKPVQDLAMELLKGSISFADYRKAARDLTPIQSSQAMSFYQLAAATHRIGDEQMTGSQALQVYSQALARATGDATGMNVALMLTGANADTTNDIVKKIGESSLEAGGHVQGWAAIQETFNFKMAQTKAALGVVGVELGTTLLPVMGMLAEKLTGILGPMAEWIRNNQNLTAQIAIAVTAFVGFGTAVLVVGRMVAGIKALAIALRIAALAQWLLNAAVGTHFAITSAAEVKIAAYLVWTRLVAAATKIWAAAQWLLNAAFSPMGLVVIAIVAVVAAVVYAYFHFDKFREIVDNAFKVILIGLKAWWEYAKMAFEFYRHLIVDIVGPAIMWLWRNVLVPAYEGMVVAIKAWWVYAEFVFNALRVFIMDIIVPAVIWMWQHVWEPAFKAIRFLLQAWWVIAQVIFEAVKITIMSFVVGPIILLWNLAKAVWPLISGYIMAWWEIAKFVFNFFSAAINLFVIQPIRKMIEVTEPIWRRIGDVIMFVWTQSIKPTFENMANFITKTLPEAFGKGVGFIKAAFEGIKTAVSIPINWVIRYVINDGIINAWNWLAGKFGVKDRIGKVPEIGGNNSSIGGGGGGGGGSVRAMAEGGAIRGIGGPRQDNIPIMASAGEYIIPAHVVSGIGVGWFDTLIGKRKPVDRAGDGSSGIAIGHYADGGFIDFLRGPANWVGNRVNGFIDRIPGGGIVRDISVAASRRLVEKLIEWAKNKLSSLLGGGSTTIPLEGGMPGILAWLQAQHGKPYGWAQAGPRSYDCSGIVSAVWNIMHGITPYRHTFSTMGQGLFFPRRNQVGILTAGWANPGERGGGSVGHTAANFAGIGFESTGSRGVRVGSGTTPVTSFAHWGTFANGGLIGDMGGIRRYDRGGRWPSGTLGINTSGQTETVTSGDGLDRLEMRLARIEAAIDRVAPSLGREINGGASALHQRARSR